MKNKNKNTQGNSRSVKKILNQLRRLADTQKFRARVREIRLTLDIPEPGFEMTENDKNNLGYLFHIPENANIPKGSMAVSFMKQSNLLIRPLADQLATANIMLVQVLKSFVFYNLFNFNEIGNQMTWTETIALCELEDTKQTLAERFMGDVVDPSLAIDFVDYQIKSANRYPIILRIHPDASKRDVIDYLENNWSRIKNIQELYPIDPRRSVKNSKVNLNEKNRIVGDFIYKHKELALKEIKRLLLKELGITKAYEEIGKIKSLEKKRRESM